MDISSPAELPFTRESVLKMLWWGKNPARSPFSHKQIAEWCDRFWCQYIDIDATEEIETLLPILADIDTQWDLFLVNTYPIEQLKKLDLDLISMPVEWFTDWTKQIN